MTGPSPDVLAAVADVFTHDGAELWLMQWHRSPASGRARMEEAVLGEWSGVRPDPAEQARAAAAAGATRARAIVRATVGHREDTP